MGKRTGRPKKPPPTWDYLRTVAHIAGTLDRDLVIQDQSIDEAADIKSPDRLGSPNTFRLAIQLALEQGLPITIDDKGRTDAASKAVLSALALEPVSEGIAGTYLTPEIYASLAASISVGSDASVPVPTPGGTLAHAENALAAAEREGRIVSLNGRYLVSEVKACWPSKRGRGKGRGKKQSFEKDAAERLIAFILSDPHTFDVSLAKNPDLDLPHNSVFLNDTEDPYVSSDFRRFRRRCVEAAWQRVEQLAGMLPDLTAASTLDAEQITRQQRNVLSWLARRR